MSETQLPQITLVRHGETAWSRSGQHTGRSDIPLTPAGEDAARTLAPRLAKKSYAAVWSSPSSRAVTTCALAGLFFSGLLANCSLGPVSAAAVLRTRRGLAPPAGGAA